MSLLSLTSSWFLLLKRWHSYWQVVDWSGNSENPQVMTIRVFFFFFFNQRFQIIGYKQSSYIRVASSVPAQGFDSWANLAFCGFFSTEQNSSEKNLLIFAFSSWFFTIFPDFVPLFPNFRQIFRCQKGHSSPLIPRWLRHWRRCDPWHGSIGTLRQTEHMWHVTAKGTLLPLLQVTGLVWMGGALLFSYKHAAVFTSQEVDYDRM